jgi:uncharacterized membrane protein
MKGETLSNLIAVAYDDVDTAKTVLAQLRELSVEHAITLDDAVVAERRPDGKIKLHQSLKPGAAGAAGGAMWGGLIGLLFLAPFLGMAVGAASGGAVGAMSDFGVDDRFMKDLASDMEPGTAAARGWELPAGWRTGSSRGVGPEPARPARPRARRAAAPRGRRTATCGRRDRRTG